MPESIKVARIAFVVAAGLEIATAALFLFIFVSGAVLVGWGTERSGLLGSALLGATGIVLAVLFAAFGVADLLIAAGHRQGPALGAVRRDGHGRPPARRLPRRHGPRRPRPHGAPRPGRPGLVRLAAGRPAGLPDPPDGRLDAAPIFISEYNSRDSTRRSLLWPKERSSRSTATNATAAACARRPAPRAPWLSTPRTRPSSSGRSIATDWAPASTSAPSTPSRSSSGRARSTTPGRPSTTS